MQRNLERYREKKERQQRERMEKDDKDSGKVVQIYYEEKENESDQEEGRTEVNPQAEEEKTDRVTIQDAKIK